jgi:hypothetical protein
MASLYEINQSIMDCIDMETGEIIDIDQLHELQMDRTDKIRNIACYIKNLRSDAAAYDEEAKTFAARKKAAQTKAESLTAYLSSMLNGEKVKDKEYSISWRKSESVNITDDSLLPDTYLVPQPPKVDKAGIKAALKAGTAVTGAELAEKNNIQIK